MMDTSRYSILNLGCGMLTYGPDVLNVDIRQTAIVHVLADLNDYPWPLKNACFEYVYMTDIYEHLREAYLPLEECWRVLQPEGRLFIRTSYWKSENSYTCPDHLRFCTLHTMDFYDRRTPFGVKYAFFSPARFEILDAQVSGEELSFALKKEVLDDGTWEIKSCYPKRRY